MMLRRRLRRRRRSLQWRWRQALAASHRRRPVLSARHADAPSFAGSGCDGCILLLLAVSSVQVKAAHCIAEFPLPLCRRLQWGRLPPRPRPPPHQRPPPDRPAPPPAAPALARGLRHLHVSCPGLHRRRDRTGYRHRPSAQVPPPVLPVLRHLRQPAVPPPPPSASAPPPHPRPPPDCPGLRPARMRPRAQAARRLEQSPRRKRIARGRARASRRRPSLLERLRRRRRLPRRLPQRLPLHSPRLPPESGWRVVLEVLDLRWP